MHRTAVLHRQGSRASMITSVTPLVALRSDEGGQDLPVRPPRRAFLRPAIEIGCISADIDHGVHRRTAAECSAARQVDPSLSQTGLLLCCVVTVVLYHVQW